MWEELAVLTWMALGMTRAVDCFSMETISEKAIVDSVCHPTHTRSVMVPRWKQ